LRAEFEFESYAKQKNRLVLAGTKPHIFEYPRVWSWSKAGNNNSRGTKPLAGTRNSRHQARLLAKAEKPIVKGVPNGYSLPGYVKSLLLIERGES